MAESKLYSHHIFIFPFKWEQLGSEEQRFNIELFDKKLNKAQWEENKFNLGQKDRYNEYNYFYRHVREILYEKSDDLIEEEKKTNDLIKHYEYNLGNTTHYWIKVNIGKDDTGKDKIVTYKLEIDSIILNIYATGTGVLSFHLRNKDYSDSEDIIKINQYGRRIYPPFLNINDKKTTERSFLDKEDKSGVPSVPRAELSSAIWLGGADDYQNNDSPYYDDFRVYDSCKNYKKGPFLIPKFIRGLFEQNSSEKTTDIIITPNKRDLEDKTDKHKYVYMDTVLDDRMYVVCWFGDNVLSNKLKRISSYKEKRYSYSDDGWWYRYVFVDGGALTLQDPFLMQDTLIKNSYTRWIDYGTLYGVSRYSFVALTSDFKTLQNNNASFTVKHVQSIYYKIAELCLLQRASILSYSEELSEIVKNLNGAINLEKVKGLYKRFMQFKTKICFDEVTAQDQGIEIYNLIRREMAIQLELESLEKRITEMYNYAALVEQENEKEETKRLNQIAMWLTALAVPSLLISILSITSFDHLSDKLLCQGSFWPFWGGMILVVILSFLILVSIFWSKVKSRYNYLFQLLIVLLVIIYCSIGYLTFCII
jgi:hypothetical protein